MEKPVVSFVLGMPVMISDDDEFFRMALRSILISRLGVSEVIETATFDEALEALSREPNLKLALFDLNMPGMNNWDDLRSVRDTFPAVHVAVVSASCSREDILQALDVGVHGFVTKGSGIAELGRALQQICQGSVYVPSSLPNTSVPAQIGAPVHPSTALVGHQEEPNVIGKRLLSARQEQILKMLVAGKPNKVMARSLNLSEGTIKFHISAVFRVLGASNRVEAATAGARLLQSLERQDNEGQRASR